MITQQEKDVKAADKEDAGKEDVEETKKRLNKNSVKLPQLISNLLKKNWVAWRTKETNPGYFVKLSENP